MCDGFAALDALLRRDYPPLLDVKRSKIVFRFFSIFNELPLGLVLTMRLASVALACRHRRVRRAPILSALARARAVCSARGLALALASTNTRALAIAAASLVSRQAAGHWRI